MFLALEVELISDDMQKILLFSPKVMKWSEGIWLIDLAICQSYWQSRSWDSGCCLEDLYKMMLEKTFGNQYRAALAQNPWQALLTLNFMQERALQGLVAKEQEWGAKIYQSVSWSAFFSVALSGAQHFESLKFKGFKLKPFANHLEQMRRAVNQLGIKTPWEFQSVGSYAIRRRYGSMVKQIWEQMYPGSEAPVIFCPWKSFHLVPEMVVLRTLDHAIDEWQHLEGFLREDLDKLCQLDVYSADHRIVSLEWCLTLQDACHLRVSIQFRRPHSLHSETHSHETALLQAYYNFERTMKKESQRYQENTGDGNISIVAWKLSIKEWLFTPPQAIEMFNDHLYEEEALSQLENRLPSQLHRYQIKDDWSVETSFSAYDSSKNIELEHARALNSLASSRPLFLYRDLKPLSITEDQCKSLRFGERTMNHWWQEPESADLDNKSFTNDYYQYLDDDKRLLWVCRGKSDQWRAHGLFA